MRLPLLLSALLCATALAAGESRIDLDPGQRDSGAVLGALSALTGERHELAIDLLVAGLGDARPLLRLSQATPAGARQALAHALDAWWLGDADGGVTYLRARRLPHGRLGVRSLTSVVRGRPGVERIVSELLDPWLGGDAGISLTSEDGVWSATLDDEGHARLVEAIDLIERSTPRASALVGDPDLPDPRRLLAAPLRAASWTELVDRLAPAGGISVSVAPALAARAFPAGGVALAPIALGGLPRALVAAGVPAAGWCHGVLCLAATPDDGERLEREHPARRRRLALIPVPHLVRDQGDGERLAGRLRATVCPWWWSEPGAGLRHLDGASALLIAADPPVLHRVLEALALLDRQVLAAPAPAEGR
jgi:hypothetical protein